MYGTPDYSSMRAGRYNRRAARNRILVAVFFILGFCLGAVWTATDANAAGPEYALDLVDNMERTATPPTARADGSPFDVDTELSHYQPYYSQDEVEWTLIDAPFTSLPFVIPFDGIPIGQNYLAVTTVDSDGREGERSNVFPFELEPGSPPMPLVLDAP